MASGYGFVSPPEGNPGFFKYQQTFYANPEPQNDARDPEGGQYGDEEEEENDAWQYGGNDPSSVPVYRTDSGPITPDRYPDRVDSPRFVSYPAPPPTPAPTGPTYAGVDRPSVPITFGQTGPVTPDTQPPSTRLVRSDPEPAPVRQPSQYSVPDRPSVPLGGGQQYPIGNAGPSIPLRISPSPTVQPTRDTGQPTVPIHEPDRSPIVPAGPERPPLFQRLVRQPQEPTVRDTGQPTVPIHEPDRSPIVPRGPERPAWYSRAVRQPQEPSVRDTGQPTVPIHEPDRSPIVPTGPERPAWYPSLVRSSQEPTVRDTGQPTVPIREPDLSPIVPTGPERPAWQPSLIRKPDSQDDDRSRYVRDQASVPVHEMKLNPVLPPSGPAKPVWIEYPNWMDGGKSKATTDDDMPSVAILGHHLPILPPPGPGKPVWELYGGGGRPGDQPTYEAARDRNSIRIGDDNRLVLPPSDAGKPIWELYPGTRPKTEARRDMPSVPIGPKPDAKMSGSGDEKTKTWKPVKPIARKDEKSVAIGSEKQQKVYKLIPADDEPGPKRAEPPEVITLHPEKPAKDEDIVKLYREDPNQEPDLWIHSSDMTSNRRNQAGPYITKLVVSETGRIPLTPVTSSRCRRSGDRTSSLPILTGYLSTGSNDPKNYMPQCTG